MTKIKTISEGASESVSQWPGFLKSCYQCTFSSFYVTTNKYFYVTTKIFFCRLKIFLGHYKFVMSPQVPCDQSFFMPPQHFYATTTFLCHHKRYFYVTTIFVCHHIFKSPRFFMSQKYFYVTTKIFTCHHKNMPNEDTGHIVCWATTVKHKNIAQQRNLFLVIKMVFSSEFFASCNFLFIA